jgi:hypothetical protein
MQLNQLVEILQKKMDDSSNKKKVQDSDEKRDKEEGEEKGRAGREESEQVVDSQI